MSGRGDSLALAVVLAFGLAADGVMEALGPLTFAWVSLVILALAVALHLTRREERT